MRSAPRRARRLVRQRHLLRALSLAAKDRNRARGDAEEALESLGRGEAQRVGSQELGERLEVHALAAGGDHQPVPLSLLVPDEDVLRVHRVHLRRDDRFRLFAGEDRLVVKAFVGDAVVGEERAERGVSEGQGATPWADGRPAESKLLRSGDCHIPCPAFVAVPRIVGRTSGQAFRMLSRLRSTMTNPAAAMASAVLRVR